MALFLAHARRLQPDFEVAEAERPAIARICRLVGGMPLALELAASWVRYLPPADIAGELADDLDFLESARADLPARQRSMRAAFEHSWDLLQEEQRAGLMRLSVFRGGASREAARAVTGVSLRTLVTLADHSLVGVKREAGRFAVHELIRQFAGERLAEVGEGEGVRDAHSDYYLRRLAERLPDLKGRDQLEALDEIEREFENVRAAWRRAARRGRWQQMPEASQSLFLFSLFRDRYRDGIALFDTVYRTITSPTTATERLASAYTLAGSVGLRNHMWPKEAALASIPELETVRESLTDSAAVAFCQLTLGQTRIVEVAFGDESPAAVEALEAACAYYQQEQESFYNALSFTRLGLCRHRAGKLEDALELFRRGLELARQAGDRFVTATLLQNLGVNTLVQQGPTKVAESYFEQAAKLGQEIGAPVAYAISLGHLGRTRIWREGALAKGRPMLEEAMAIAAEQNNPIVRADTLAAFAMYWRLAGQYEKVLALTKEVLLVGEGREYPWFSASVERGIAFLALGRVDDALPFLKQALSWLLQAGWPALSLLPFFGILLARQDQHQRATELLSLGLTRSYYRGSLAIDPLLTRFHAELEETLGEETFAAAWERGKQLDPKVAAEEVLEALD